ncbi:SAF domain-containing protein [Sinomonas sp.]|uniref:SAF domain-containing protein n=1 Tax=Sinomonas sp. TaxID=1914986 RepID=UPI002FDFCE19
MSTAGTQAGLRLRKPSWKDPRLLLGLLLVLASVAGVVGLVRSAEAGNVVYAAKDDIPVGQPVGLDQLVPVEVRLGAALDRYVAEGDLPSGRVAVQRVSKGDLIPASSLGSADVLGRSPVAIGLQEPLPAEAVAGTRADVWVALPDGRNGFAEPKLLIPASEIAQVQSAAPGLGGPRETVVYVLVDPDKLPQLLAAQANKARISVVWNPSGRTR